MKQRSTRQRRLVLDAVRARCDHPSAEQIYRDVRAVDDKISRGTVYRNLNVLEQSGEILHVKLPVTDRYEVRADRHDHMICSRCHAVCDVPIPYDEALDERATGETGYLVLRHRVVFEGLCPDCREKIGKPG